MIEGQGLTRTFPGRGGLLSRGAVHALRGVDFVIPDHGAVSFIGESGCGKTTLGRILCGLEDFDGGDLVIDGQSMAKLPRRQRGAFLRRIQIIHQDPYSALNPTRTIGSILADPLALRARQLGKDEQWASRRRDELLGLVGLDPGYVLPRYPHMLSGGMRQRVVIARALTVDPAVLVADEAVSMIDVSLRLGILELLRELRDTVGVSLLFITHDVATARYVGQDGQLYVIYRGVVVERGSTDSVIQSPVHPYSQSLLSAIPVLHGIEQPGPDRVLPTGPLEERVDPPGCLFEPRCPFAQADCTTALPPLRLADETGHEHRCLYPERRSVVAVPMASGAGA
jgi:oligopeptide/dipeptide ABC transporter ATP-binding protein